MEGRALQVPVPLLPPPGDRCRGPGQYAACGEGPPGSGVWMGGAPPHRAVSRKWGHVVKMKPHVAVKTYGDVRANVSHVNSIPAFPTLIGKSHRSPAFPSPPHTSLPDLSGSLLRCPQHRQPRSPAFRRSPNSRRPLSWGPASPTQGPLL